MALHRLNAFLDPPPALSLGFGIELTRASRARLAASSVQEQASLAVVFACWVWAVVKLASAQA